MRRATEPREVLETPLRLRFARREYEELAQVAQDLGLPLSTYIRRAVLGRPLPPRRVVQIPEVNRQLYLELAHVGSNLNQIARGVNTGTDVAQEPARRELIQILELLAETVAETRGLLIGAVEPAADGTQG